MMHEYRTIIAQAVKQQWVLWSLLTMGLIFLYYGGLLLVTVIRFHEIPNYLEIYDIVRVYQQIFEGTPSLKDALQILVDEAWVEAGYKNPEYYGIATWSYMLIPPKMFIVVVMAALVATFVVLSVYSRKQACPIGNRRRLYAAAGVGSGLVGMGSATLTWVVCCATPSWVVGLAMLGMSSSLALWLEPFGKIINLLGVALVLWIISLQLKSIASYAQRSKTN
ncbi:MAG: hypothetical protein L0Z73_15665 [Gammaproteobacteria bacterium]|nr:hypothetical protein [Gammaproteobacteria bacterium]